MSPRGSLLGLVRRVRRRAFLLGLACVVLSCLAGLLIGPLLSAAVLPWTAEPWRRWVAIGCLALGAAAGLGLALWEWRRTRPIRSWEEAARLLASARPEARNLIHTGADLAAWGPGGAEARGASPALAEAQVELAARVAEGAEWRKALPAKPLLPRLLAFVAALGALAAWAGANPGKSIDAWRVLLEGRPLPAVSVGNLRLRYEPPAYTGLAAASVEGASGAVEGLKGTRVTLEGELSGPADAGQWEDSDGRRAALEVKGKAFRVSWILDRPGSYGLSFWRGGKRLPSDFQPQSVSIAEDARPLVDLKAPEGDLEVRSDGEVEIRFSASDDFRVDRVEVVLQGEVEVRIPAKVTPARSVEGGARFLPLAFPKLGAGANLRVEAWDSDSVSGPKAGASRSVYVTFLDKKKIMADIQGLEERLLEALLAHLADHLEAKAPKAQDLVPLRARAADLLKLFSTLVERVRQGAEEGALGAVAVLRMEEGLRSTLGPFIAGAENREELTAELERDVLFLDRLIRNLRMEETLSLADELTALQRGLFDQITAGAKTENLLGQIDQIERLLRQMMEKLGRGASEMPDAFANADAVKDAPSSELQEALEKLKKTLREGNREAARKAAEKLLDTISRWMRALEDAAEAASGRESDPVLRDMAKLESDVRALMAEQDQVLRETRSLADEASRRAANALRGDLQSLLARREQRLNQIAEYARRLESLAPPRPFHGALPPPRPPSEPGSAPPAASPLDLFEASRRVSAAISEVRQALRQDMGRARSGAEALDEAFEALRQKVTEQLGANDGRRDAADRTAEAGKREVDALREDLAALDRLRLRALGPKEQQALRGLGSDERGLGERTDGVAEKLEELARRTPFVGSGLPDRARSSSQSMDGAAGKLGQGDAFGALSPEGEAMEGLSEIAKALEGARQQMQQGKGRAGFRTVPSPGQPGGGREVDRSHVEIPKEAEARELKAFREEVLKAMRRGQYPRNYEDEVEKYYERLIR